MSIPRHTTNYNEHRPKLLWRIIMFRASRGAATHLTMALQESTCASLAMPNKREWGNDHSELHDAKRLSLKLLVCLNTSVINEWLLAYWRFIPIKYSSILNEIRISVMLTLQTIQNRHIHALFLERMKLLQVTFAWWSWLLWLRRWCCHHNFGSDSSHGLV